MDFSSALIKVKEGKRSLALVGMVQTSLSLKQVVMK